MLDSNSNDVKIEVLQDLIDHMKALEGQKMRPKDAEVSITEMKPEPGEGSPEEEKKDAAEQVAEGPGDHKGMGEGGDDDDLSEEDAAMIEQLLSEQEA